MSLALWLGLSITMFSVGLLIILFVLLLLANVFYKELKLYYQQSLLGFLLFCFLFVAGFVIVQDRIFREREHPTHFSNFKANVLQVKIIEEPKVKPKSVQFRAEVLQSIQGYHLKPTSGYLLVRIAKDTSQKLVLNYGDELLIPANFQEVAPKANPATFDYRAYLLTQNIKHQIFVPSTHYKVIATQKGNYIIAIALTWRKQLIAKYQQLMQDKNAIAVASTLILGYKAELDESIIEAYAKTGTIHVLSVSGMHLGLIYIAISFLLARLPKNKNEKHFKVLITLMLVWFYALLTGFSSPVCRSAVMISLFTIGSNYSKNAHPLNILSISAWALLCYNPLYLLDVGFQLSYLSMLGLLVIYPKMQQWCYTPYRFLNYLLEAVAVSLAATMSTFPISVYYFHQFPTWFIISNLFIIIPAAFIMSLGIFTLLPLPNLWLKPLAWLLQQTILFTNLILKEIEHLPYANIQGLWIEHIQYLLIYALLASVLLYLTYLQRQWIWTSLVLILLLCTSFSLKDIQQQRQNTMIFYGLKKGIALGFVHGKQAIVITDISRVEKSFRYAIAPSLDSLNVARDVIILKPRRYIRESYLYVNQHFIYAFKKRILLLDSSFRKEWTRKDVAVDWVILHQNPKIRIQDLHNISFKKVFFSPSNSNYRIAQWEQECYLRRLPSQSLKYASAFVWKE